MPTTERPRVAGKIQAEEPEEMVFSLTLTMDLRDWTNFVQQMEAGEVTIFPCSHVRTEIKDLIARARCVLTVDREFTS